MRKLIFLILLCVTFGCSKSDDPNVYDNGVPWYQIASAPKVDLPKESLPGWLIVKINDYYEIRPPLFCKVLIYKGRWNEHTIYFIVDTYIHLATAYRCDFFTASGEMIVDTLDFRATSKNWVLIYEYGDFVFNLDELFKN